MIVSTRAARKTLFLKDLVEQCESDDDQDCMMESDHSDDLNEIRVCMHDAAGDIVRLPFVGQERGG